MFGGGKRSTPTLYEFWILNVLHVMLILKKKTIFDKGSYKIS